MSTHQLLVLIDGADSARRLRREFLSSLEADGDCWETRAGSTDELVKQVRANAPGDFVLLLDHDDLPTAECVSEIRRACDEYPLADVIYADKLGSGHGRSKKDERLRFPNWSPHRIQYEQFVGKSFLIRVSTLLSMAPLLDAHESLDLWELLRLCAHRRARVAHADSVWFTYSPSTSASRRVMAPALPVVEGTPAAPSLAPRCSLITLTAGTPDMGGTGGPLIGDHLRAIRGTDSANAQVVIVIGNECRPDVRKQLEDDRSITVVVDEERFNFARRSNIGRGVARGDILVFVNDDFVPLRDDWLERLTAPLSDPQVGITGATLLFGDDTIQHLGVGIIDGQDCHFYRGSALSDPRVAELILMNREVDAVTGACLAIRA